MPPGMANRPSPYLPFGIQRRLAPYRSAPVENRGFDPNGSPTPPRPRPPSGAMLAPEPAQQSSFGGAVTDQGGISPTQPPGVIAGDPEQDQLFLNYALQNMPSFPSLGQRVSWLVGFYGRMGVQLNPALVQQLASKWATQLGLAPAPTPAQPPMGLPGIM